MKHLRIIKLSLSTGYTERFWFRRWPYNINILICIDCYFHVAFIDSLYHHPISKNYDLISWKKIANYGTRCKKMWTRWYEKNFQILQNIMMGPKIIFIADIFPAAIFYGRTRLLAFSLRFWLKLSNSLSTAQPQIWLFFKNSFFH